MNLFETSGGEFINLDQVTRFESGAGQITLHFEGENEVTLHNDDAKKLAPILAKFAADFARRTPKA
jgi:hypothetical protein